MPHTTLSTIHSNCLQRRHDSLRGLGSCYNLQNDTLHRWRKRSIDTCPKPLRRRKNNRKENGRHRLGSKWLLLFEVKQLNRAHIRRRSQDSPPKSRARSCVGVVDKVRAELYASYCLYNKVRTACMCFAVWVRAMQEDTSRSAPLSSHTAWLLEHFNVVIRHTILCVSSSGSNQSYFPTMWHVRRFHPGRFPKADEKLPSQRLTIIILGKLFHTFPWEEISASSHALKF